MLEFGLKFTLNSLITGSENECFIVSLVLRLVFACSDGCGGDGMCLLFNFVIGDNVFDDDDDDDEVNHDFMLNFFDKLFKLKPVLLLVLLI